MRAVRRRLDASSLMAQKSPPFVILNRHAVQGHLRLEIDYEDMPLATSWATMSHATTLYVDGHASMHSRFTTCTDQQLCQASRVPRDRNAALLNLPSSESSRTLDPQ